MGDSVFGERPALRYAVSAVRGRGRLRVPLPRDGPEQVPAGRGPPGAGGRSPRLSRARGWAEAEKTVSAPGRRAERCPGAARPTQALPRTPGRCLSRPRRPLLFG